MRYYKIIAKIILYWIFSRRLDELFLKNPQFRFSQKVIFGLPMAGTILISLCVIVRSIFLLEKGEVKVQFIKGHEDIGICIRQDIKEEDSISIFLSRLFGAIISIVDITLSGTC